ncbi:MAG: 1-acyl-sn-glycerol-3-phosphate acyltransferase [Saccharofermentans sp.]|nr:1-acyl-sn-glycerol-3-phosphate acyltransferase [Saccharofermentans sp.]
MADNNTQKAATTKQGDIYPKKRGFIGNFAARFFFLLCDITVDMKPIGRENFPLQDKYVVAVNHQSFSDGMLVAKYLPKGYFKYMCALVGADLETDYGWLGRLIVRVGRGIPVDRHGNPIRGLIKAKKEVEKGNICFVFPEGTRCHDGKLGEMKDGAAYIAIKAGVPLVPVYLAGAYDVWPRGQKWPHPYKGFLKRRKIRVYIGEPLDGKDYDNDAHKLTDAMSEWMHLQEKLHMNPELD